MSRIIFILLTLSIFLLSCKKDDTKIKLSNGNSYDKAITYKYKYRKINFFNQNDTIGIATSVDLEAYSVNDASFVLVNFFGRMDDNSSLLGSYMSFIGQYTFMDQDSALYGDYSYQAVRLRSDMTNLNKPASFKFEFYGPQSTGDFYYNEIKPYKVIFNGVYDNIRAHPFQIVPVTNYQIDSNYRVITFNETELNCAYFVGRKL